MGRTKEQDREYQRQRRARLKGVTSHRHTVTPIVTPKEELAPLLEEVKEALAYWRARDTTNSLPSTPKAKLSKKASAPKEPKPKEEKIAMKFLKAEKKVRSIIDARKAKEAERLADVRECPSCHAIEPLIDNGGAFRGKANFCQSCWDWYLEIRDSGSSSFAPPETIKLMQEEEERFNNLLAK
jgi:hypothetical protein